MTAFEQALVNTIPYISGAVISGVAVIVGHFVYAKHEREREFRAVYKDKIERTYSLLSEFNRASLAYFSNKMDRINGEEEKIYLEGVKGGGALLSEIEMLANLYFPEIKQYVQLASQCYTASNQLNEESGEDDEKPSKKIYMISNNMTRMNENVEKAMNELNVRMKKSF